MLHAADSLQDWGRAEPDFFASAAILSLLTLFRLRGGCGGASTEAHEVPGARVKDKQILLSLCHGMGLLSYQSARGQLFLHVGHRETAWTMAPLPSLIAL